MGRRLPISANLRFFGVGSLPRPVRRSQDATFALRATARPQYQGRAIAKRRRDEGGRRKDSARGFNPGNPTKKGPAPTGPKSGRNHGFKRKRFSTNISRPFRAARDVNVSWGENPRLSPISLRDKNPVSHPFANSTPLHINLSRTRTTTKDENDLVIT